MKERQDVLQRFVMEMRGMFGESLKKIILYGSYARGDNRNDSDIDIMILTALSDNEIRKIEDKAYDIAFGFEVSDKVHTNVNIRNEDHFNYWLGALLYYDNIEREGILLDG